MLLIPSLFAMFPCLVAALLILGHASTGKFLNSVNLLTVQHFVLHSLYERCYMNITVKLHLHPDLTKKQRAQTRTHVEI